MKSRPDRRHIWEALDAAVADGSSPVLATVLRTEGSTPLDAGARAVIAPSGSLLAGTVGGGLLEGETLRRAAGVAATGEPDLFDFHLHGPGGTDAYPICGGTVRILLQPVHHSELTAYQDAQRAVHERRSGLLTTIVKARGQQPMSIETSWREIGTNGHGVRYSADPDRELLEEPIAPAPRLLVVGAGHVGQALAAHAHLAGFDLAVIDDRAELLDTGNFPPDTQLFAGALAETVAAFPSDLATYIALVTRGHRADAEALAHCLRKPHAYLGMIGSRRKARLMREHFLKESLSTAEEFDLIHTPIGLEIGAETAPEIAVSIVAQLIAVKNRLPAASP